MLINHFRLVERQPAEIHSLSTNDETILVCRSEGLIDLYDSYTLNNYLSFDLQTERINCSEFLNGRCVVMGTTCSKIIVLDIYSLEKHIFKACGSIIALTTSYKKNNFREYACFSTSNNEVFELDLLKPNKINLIYKGKFQITSIFLANDNRLIIGDEKGKIKIIHEGKICGEFKASNFKINNICKVNGSIYCCVTADGFLIVFDFLKSAVLQAIEVRKSSLNCCVSFDNAIYCSGLDSRLISYAMNDIGLFTKLYQTDAHYSETIALIVDNKRIVSGGKDTTLVQYWPCDDKFVFRINYFSKRITGFNDKILYINNETSIDIYKKDKTQSKNEMLPLTNNDDEDSFIFKISPDSLSESFFQKEHFDYLLKFSLKGKALSSFITPDLKYIAYSSSDKTKLYNLYQGSKLNLEHIRDFPPSYQIILSNDHLVMLTLKRELIVFSLQSFEILKTLKINSFKERAFLVNSYLILSDSKICYDLNSLESFALGLENIIDCIIEFDADSALILTHENTYEKNITYNLFKYSFGKQSVALYSRIECDSKFYGMFLFKGRIYFYNSSKLYILAKNKQIRNMKLGAVIYDVIVFDNNILVIQDPWDNIKKSLEKGIFKEKYGKK